MAQYTIEVRDFANNSSELFDFDYNFYNENETDKQNFEDKFYNRYKFDEIGFETIALFKHYLQTSLNEVQPRYKHLYETTQYEYDPLKNYDVDETINVSNDSTGSGDSTQYDTPIGSKDNYSKTPSFITENNTTSNDTGSTTRKTEGNIGVQTSQDLIQKERAIIENIDERLIKELATLFMGVM